MILQNIFLPEQLGGYYLFSKRILGMDIGKTHVNAILVRLHGHTVTIEQCFAEKIEQNTATLLDDRIRAAIKSIIDRVDYVDELYSTLSSSLIVFKELKLPFTSYDKIKMVVNFEIEPLLPFALNDAVIDFIITRQLPDEKSSEILVAAVPKQYIVQHMQLFEGMRIQPTRITVDLFALYSLYMHIPIYQNLSGSIALIDLGIQSTRIAYIHNGQLRLIRTLPNGMYQVAKTVSESLHIPLPQAMETIIRFGFEKDTLDYKQALTTALTTLWNSINFTLTSFIAQSTQIQGYTKLLLLGGGSELKGLPTFVVSILNTPCELFDGTTIASIPTIISKNKHTLPNTALVSLSAVAPSPIINQFNLRKDEFSGINYALIVKQVATAGALVFILFTALITHTIIQVRKLNHEITIIQTEAIDALKERFKIIEPDERNLEDALDTAKQELKQEEATWFAFSSRARSSFLQYLLELTSSIDQEGLGFIAEQLTISEGIMTLKAQVRDHEALKNLERELRQSKLFSHIGPLEDPIFTVKITLAPNRGQN